MIYLDTSWLVKLYVNEPDSAAARTAVDGQPTLIVSELAYVEFHSVVARRRRDGSLTARAAGRLLADLEDGWPRYVRVPVSRDILTRAAGLLRAHSLRTLDALQLAAAMLVADGSPQTLTFGATDRRLRAAAAAAGLPLLPMPE